MKFLITGGAGFIGSHLADALLARGDAVVALDDLSTGSTENIERARGHASFEFCEGCVTDGALVGRLASECDAILHMAAAVGVRRVIAATSASMDVNLRGTQTVLQTADRLAKPVVLASSSEVYGKGHRIPFAEDDDVLLGATCSPRWSYAGAKAVGEWLALSLAREHGVRVLCMRLFNTVGPRQTGRYGMVLPTFVRQAIRDEPLTVYGDGAQARCFGHVRDVVACALRLFESDKAWGTVVNVGSDLEITIDALARLVRERCASSSEIEHVDYASVSEISIDEPLRRVPDLSRLRACIGDVPTTPIEHIVDDVIARVRTGVETA